MMKFALVTGGTKGIGKAYVLRLLQENYSVIVNYNQDENAAQLLDQELKITYEGRYFLVRHDLSRFEEIDLFCTKVKDFTQVLDLLVLNVGYTDRTSFPGIKPESWQKALDTNLSVPFFIVQNLIDLVPPKGNILFTGSLMGILPHSMSLLYGVTKAAVKALVENLVKFLAEKQIRVNYIAPGFIETEWQKEKPKEIRQNIENKIALKQFGSPEQVADAMMFIVNNEYMNGHSLVIDGGYNYK